MLYTAIMFQDRYHPELWFLIDRFLIIVLLWLTIFLMFADVRTSIFEYSATSGGHSQITWLTRRYMILLSTQVVYFKSGLSNILSHTASQKFKCYHHWLMPITCHFRESDSFRFKNAVTLCGGYLRGDFSRRVLTAMFPGSYFLASSLYAEHSKKTH